MDADNLRDLVRWNPTEWFVRLFARTSKRSIAIYVPVETARRLAPGFTIEEAPPVFGAPRIYIDSIPQRGQSKISSSKVHDL